MANWVTLPNGVHIDLDDPHNPVTGDGKWEDLGGGDTKGNSQGAGPKTVKFGGHEYPVGEKPNPRDMASIRNEYGLEKLGTTKVDGKTYTIYGSGFGNIGHRKEVAVLTEDDTKSGSKENQSKIEFKDDPTMSGKDSKSFDRDLELAFKEFDGDEDAILDALRSTGKDYGMSNGDLQGVVEAYCLTHETESFKEENPVKKYNEDLKRAINTSNVQEAMDIIFSNKELLEEYKKVSEENHATTFRYKLSKMKLKK